MNLHRVLGHVKKLRIFIGDLSASAEHAQLAKDIFVDSIDCSGINLQSLETILAEQIRECKDISGQSRSQTDLIQTDSKGFKFS